MPLHVRAFTLQATGILRQIRSEISVSGQDFVSGSSKRLENLSAVWDTGAVTTCISARVARQLNLKSVGKANLNGIDGSTIKDVYIVSLDLPNGVSFQNVRVNEGDLGNIDVLVGMDIITCGDFAISNLNRKTTFTFCLPSIGIIDFVKKLKTQDVLGQKHGKGNRKKR